jgi:hypothetical protein
MATRTKTDYLRVENCHITTWSGLLNGDDGESYQVLNFNDLCIQFTGTAGVGLAISLEGSNDNTNWFILNDLQGSPITKSAAGLEQVAEGPLWVRPRITGGDGTTNMAAVLVARRLRVI